MKINNLKIGDKFYHTSYELAVFEITKITYMGIYLIHVNGEDSKVEYVFKDTFLNNINKSIWYTDKRLLLENIIKEKQAAVNKFLFLLKEIKQEEKNNKHYIFNLQLNTVELSNDDISRVQEALNRSSIYAVYSELYQDKEYPYLIWDDPEWNLSRYDKKLKEVSLNDFIKAIEDFIEVEKENNEK